MKEIVNQCQIERIYWLLAGKYYSANKELIYEAIYDVICMLYMDIARFEKLSDYERERYLYKGSRNRLLYYIDKARIKSHYKNAVLNRIYANEENTDTEHCWEERWEEVMDICDMLTTDELEILEWHYFTPLMLKEIALMKNKTEAAIQKLHVRTLKKIKRMIK